MALFVKGSQVVLEHFPLPSHKGNVDSVPGGVAIACPADLYPTFEAHILQSINFLLLGTGCLLLAIDLIDLFVQRLQMPSAMRAGSFHALKSRFANFIILAMAISFLETFAIPPALQGSMLSSPAFSSSPMLISAISITVVTLALIAFNLWGGEQSNPR